MFLTTTTIVNQVAHKIMAVGWKCKLVKSFIASIGNCLPAVQQILKRTRVAQQDGHYITESYQKITSRVQVVANLFRYFSVIDVHDHYRQGTLALEEHWKTYTWWHRLFSTIMGIIYTNAYFYYRNDYMKQHHNDKDMKSYEDFLGELAYEMVHNKYDSNIIDRNSLRPRDDDDITSTIFHRTRCLQEHPIFQERKENSSSSKYRAVSYCIVCHEKCSFYCDSCSTQSKCFPICNPSSKDCINRHQQLTMEEKVACSNKRRHTA